MITPDNAVHLARVRRARGGETWLPLPDVAMYTQVPAQTLRRWVGMQRLRLVNGHLDLGLALEVRDASSVHVPGTPITYRTLAYFRLLASGCDAAEIAAKYGVGKFAVHNSIHYGTHALGARSRTQAVALLVARGLISTQEVHGTSSTTVDNFAGSPPSSAIGA